MLKLPLAVGPNVNRFLGNLYALTWYVNLGKKLSDARFTITYIGRYTKRPVIAESRILEYDRKSVVFSYEDQVTSKTFYVRLSVEEFVVRIIQHIPDKGFRQIRYGGIFASRVRSNLIPIVNNILANMRKSVNMFIGNLQNYLEIPSCPACGCEMTLIGISHQGKYVQISETYTSHPP